MLQLSQTELFATRSTTFTSGIMNAVKTKLSKSIGCITPQHIEIPLMDLKKYAKTKSAASPCLLGAIDLYENYGGRIQLFDLTTTSNGKSDIPPFFPFIPGFGIRYGYTGQPAPSIFVNLCRIGNWSLDEKTYEGVFPITDLHALLESGYVAYKFIIEKKADDILSNLAIQENLTRIYTKLFYDALIKVPGNLPLLDFQQEAGKFIIAKFFLCYVLGKDENDMSVNNIARIASNSNSSVNSLASYEDNLGISYDKLSSFLSSFGIVFFNGHATNLSDFERAWITMYGEGMALSIEYVPYLLHFLFATIHASRLGGSSRLDKRYPDLQKAGLIKLYNAIMTGVLR